MSDNHDLFEDAQTAPKSGPKFEHESDNAELDDIIELTEVIREGRDPHASDIDGPLLLEGEDENEAPKKETPKDEITGISATAGEKTEEDEEPLLETDGAITFSEGERETFQGDGFSPAESSDFSFDDASFEGEDSDHFTGQSKEHIDNILAGLEKEVSDFEKPEDFLADIEEDGFQSEASQFESAEGTLTDEEKPDEGEEPPVLPVELEDIDDGDREEGPVIHDAPGISEEKIERFITEMMQETVAQTVRETLAEEAGKVIQETVGQTVRETISEVTERVFNETVDRAVRETVAEMTEKVIQEAINTLKETIASSEL